MEQLVSLIDHLTELLDTNQALEAVAYETAHVDAADQNTVLANGKQSIEVNKLDQWHHRWTVLHYFKRFYAADEASTRYVSRMPGIIVTGVSSDVIMPLIQQINDLKDQIADEVRQGRSPYLRHKFIHEAFPQVMTEQLYRHIKVESSPVKSVWFKWVHRHVPITLAPKSAINWLIEQRGKLRGNYLPAEWEASIDAIISDIEQGHYKRLQRRRTYKSFPVCDYSYYDALGKCKTKSFNATVPLILVNQPDDAFPRHSPLKTFIASEQPAPEDNQPANATMLFRPLNLVGYKS